MPPVVVRVRRIFLHHITPPGHPERPDRLRAVIARLKESAEWKSYDRLAPVPASEAELLEIHSADHIARVRQVCEAGGGLLDDGDTHCVRESFDVATRAAGAVLVGIDAVLSGGSKAAFCAVRPPGHHATRNQPMGFCLFNNVAVGVRHAQRRHGIARVAVLDWDVHHGNGTQDIFYDDPSVLFISLHQYPFWPGTGARQRTRRWTWRGLHTQHPASGRNR